MGSLFGGGNETEVKIPEWLESQAKQNLQRAQDVASIGYTPYYGAEVASFNPMQQAGFQNTANASNAFGLNAPTNAMAGMPEAQNFGGVMGYSSAPLFEDAMSRFRDSRPAQANLIDSFFIDPVNGTRTSSGFGSVNQNVPSVPSGDGIGSTGGMTEDAVFSAPPPPEAPSITPTQPTYDQPSYIDQQAQSDYEQQLQAQQTLIEAMAEENQGLTAQAPSQFEQVINTIYPTPSEPITPETIGGMDFTSPFENNVPEVTVDSISQAGAFTPDYYVQEQDPSMLDQIAQGAGNIGRNLVDNSALGILTSVGNDLVPELITNSSLSDMIFGEQTTLTNGQLVASDGVNVLSGEMNETLGDVQDFLDDTKEFEPTVTTQPQFQTITVNDAPTVTLPTDFYQIGSMLDQSTASQSPTRNLFEMLDEQQTAKDRAKELEARRQNMFGRMR